MHATADGLCASCIEHDLSLVELHREQLIDGKKTLASIHDDLLDLVLEDDDDLFIQHTKLERLQFDGSHKTKKLLGSSIKEIPAASCEEDYGFPINEGMQWQGAPPPLRYNSAAQPCTEDYGW